MPHPRRMLVLAAALALGACGDSPSEPTVGAAASVIITGSVGTLGVGDSVLLVARVVDAGGRRVADASAGWRSLDPAVATVSETGAVRAEEAGIARIVAEVASGATIVADTARLLVEVVPATLELGCCADTALIGSVLRLTATVRDGKGRAMGAPPPVFVVSDTTVIVASQFGTNGEMDVRAGGTATITVRMAGLTASRQLVAAPRTIRLQGSGLTQVALGQGHGCGLDAAGAASCFGYNLQGALGRGSTAGSTWRSIAPVIGAPPFATIQAGSDGSCAITAQRALWCWGAALPGTASGTPTRVLDGVEVRQASVGHADGATPLSTCALAVGGEAWCWGQSPMGGRDTVPIRRAASFAFDSIATGRPGEGCGVLASGRVACWDAGRPAGAETPGAYGRAVSVGIGSTTSCLLDADGAAWCWIGAGIVATRVDYPERFRALAVAAYSACALTTGGELVCWGPHPHFGSVARHALTVPTRMARDHRFTALRRASVGACGVLASGDLACLGFQQGTGLP